MAWVPPVWTRDEQYLRPLRSEEERNRAADYVIELKRMFRQQKEALRVRGQERLQKRLREEEERRRLEAEEAEKRRKDEIDQNHRAFLARKGVAQQGVRVATRGHRVTHCYCVHHPTLDNAIHYECQGCNGIICPLCGGCLC
jgi:hypothetical protein